MPVTVFGAFAKRSMATLGHALPRRHAVVPSAAVFRRRLMNTDMAECFVPFCAWMLHRCRSFDCAPCIHEDPAGPSSPNEAVRCQSRASVLSQSRSLATLEHALTRRYSGMA